MRTGESHKVVTVSADAAGSHRPGGASAGALVKVLIADKFEDEGIAGLRDAGCEVLSEPGLSPDTLPERLAAEDPQVLVVRSTKVTPAAINAAPSLKGIIRAGSGYDNIDCNAASDRGVAVCNCPGMNAVAVAELTLGLLLCCDRRLPDQTAELKSGHWNKKEYAKARGLKGRTFGIVGMGAIGREVAARALAFGMKPVAWSRSLTPERAAEAGCEFGGASRDDLLAMLGRCDAVTVHVAATDDTKGMCDNAFFGAMPKGAYFINTSRGSVVDERALASAVRERGFRCGLDVYQGQPSESDAPWKTDLLDLPGVYGTHHCGASTDQAQMAVADEVVRIVQGFLDGGRWVNRVN